MSANSTIHVKNIASGKIADLKVTQEGETKSAEVIFEKETAKKTALLLHNTQLGPNHLEVTSAGADVDDDAAHPTKNADRDSDEITQEEKPRARILAEYLAHGYVVGDAAIQRGLELDATHNVSNRFLSTLQGLDEKYHATDRAKATDQSYGITQRANSLWLGLSSYFEKASNTPTGKKIAQFYTEGSRQVQEVHAEARRLADLKKEEHGGSAYKASGLEKVFGKEKTSGTAAPEAGTGTLGTSVPAAPTENVPNVSAPEGGEKH
ncbi:hypothetical protein F66182_5902 [Fusarium sp. NRRL 66182]|nr:hypothetical protein F66182_5902 [Fusarium sp. NRRL 66182]